MKPLPFRSILVAVAGLALGACEAGVLPAEGGDVAEIRIAPNAPRIEMADTVLLNARLLDATGNELDGRRLFWSSENRGVASVSDDGEVTGVATGSTRIAASADGRSGLVTVDVVPRSVRRVSVSPPRLSLFVGEASPLTAVVLDRTDQPLEGRALSWSSADTSVATVGASGFVTGRRPGSVAIRATAEGVTGEATITVARVPVATVDVAPASASLTLGESRTLTATARAADGSALGGRDVAWSSSNPGVVSVSDEGVASAVGVGVAVITALIEGKTGSANLSVSVTPVATVELSPTSAQLFVGNAQMFTATPRSAEGAVLTGRNVTWSIADPAIARVDANGLVTAAAPGQTAATATVEGKSGSAVVSVARAPVASVEVTPVAVQMLAGSTRQLTATARDAAGRELAGREVSWSSSATAVATVSASGLVSAVAAGPVTITATIEGRSGSASVVVSAVPVASVEVSPPSAAMHSGAALQLTATLKAGDGSVLTGRVVSWTSSAPAVASVSATGLVTGQGVGQATVTASSEGISGSAVVTVTVPPVATVDVTPSAATVGVGATQQLTATVRASDGIALVGRAIAWTSSAPGVASVSSTGLVMGVAAGQATITATSEGKSDAATITVVVPVATVDVTPATASVAVGGSWQFTAVPKSAAGQTLTGRTATWTSSAPAIATVNANGLATAVAVGQASITATVEGKTGSGTLTVTQVPVATVVVTPSSSQIYVAGTQQLTVTLRSASGAVLTGRPVTLTSSAPAVASVNNSALVTGLSAGQTTITATSEGKSGSAGVTVLAPVATVTVSPASFSLKVGDHRQLSATLRDAAGNTLSGRTITWSSSNPLVASVSSTGRVTALLAGQATITATSEGKSGSAGVTVTLTFERQDERR